MSAGKWKKIGTAPTDGTPILGYWPMVEGFKGNPAGCYGVVQYRNGLWGSVDDDEQYFGEPQFWHPLPAPPAVS